MAVKSNLADDIDPREDCFNLESGFGEVAKWCNFSSLVSPLLNKEGMRSMSNLLF